MEVQEYSVIKIQAAIRVFLTRTRVLKEIRQRYEKIYDPRRKRFYYYDKVKDKSSWYKPVLLMSHDLDDIAPTFTRGEAAIKIQCIVRRYLAKLRVRLLYQQTVMTVKDKQSGLEYYYNPLAGTTRWELPSFMVGRLDHQRKPPRKSIPKPKKKVSPADATTSNTNKDDKLKNGDKIQEKVTELSEEEEDAKDESEESGDGDSEAESEDSETRRAKRRQNRKFPRSKVQALVDAGEDNISNTFELDLSNIGAKRFSSRIYDLVQLRRLNLSYNYLRKISDNIQFLSKLQYLDVRHNQIRHMPQEIEELTDITEFYAGYNRLSTYSANFYKLKKMVRLDLSYNKFQELPLESGNLELVNELGEWEVGIGMFRNLLFLDLRGNLLEKFPEQVERLELLEELYLSENKLTEIPSDLGGLEKLKILFIHHNKINRIATDLYSLQNLQELKANNNELFELPPLEAAIAAADPVPIPSDEPDPESEPVIDDNENNNVNSENQLDDDEATNNIVTPEMVKTTVVKKRKDAGNVPTTSPVKAIDMSYNKFVHLDNRWCKFTAMKTLNLSYNQLETMSADCFQDCRSLTYLDLSHNKLTDISVSLTSAIHLSYCDLSYNQLTDAPQGLFRSTKLKVLKMNHNKLDDITGKVMGMLYDLERLEVQYNSLKRLPGLIYGLKKVSYIDISHNNIQELSNDEFGQWNLLQYCDASYNSIPFIPESIENCGKTLEVLYFHHNQLKELPTTIAKLKKLKKFTIHNNALLMTRNVLLLMPWLLHCNLSWNREKVVKKLFNSEKLALNEEERRFTIFGAELEDYYKTQNPHELQPLSYLKKRLYEIQEELETIVSSVPEKEKAFAVDVTPFLGPQHSSMIEKDREGKGKKTKGKKGKTGTASNFDILLRWLTKLRDHIVLDVRHNENPHADVRDQLYTVYHRARNSKRDASTSKKGFHDLLVQMLSSKLQHSARTHTKIYFSNFQFRQMRPLMYYPFFLDQFKKSDTLAQSENNDEENSEDALVNKDEREYLKPNVINSLFIGFELIPSIEKLCELLNDLNILAMIEELNSLRKSDEVRDYMVKLKALEEEEAIKDSRDTSKKRKDSIVANPSSANVGIKKETGQTSGGGRFSLFSSNATKKKVPDSVGSSNRNDQSLEEVSEADREAKAQKSKQEEIARQQREEDQYLLSYPLPSEPILRLYPEGQEPTPVHIMNELAQQQRKDNYFMALMSRIAPYIDVDLIDRQSIYSSSSTGASAASKGATMSAIPLMSFPYLTLLKQDQECMQRYDQDFLYATSRQDNPFQDSLLTYFFEVYLALCKALVLHIEYVQKAMRSLERIGQQKFSRLSTLCQRDAYYVLRQDKKTEEIKLERQEDYEDLLSDVYTAVLSDQVAEEKKSADANKTVGMKKKKMIKDFVDQFFAQGELEDIEFTATQSIFKQHNNPEEQETKTETKENLDGGDDASIGSTKSLSLSQSMDQADEEEGGAPQLPIPAHEKLLEALGLPTNEETENDKRRLEEMDELLMLINTDNPSPKEAQQLHKISQTKEQMKSKQEARELEANHRIRVWLDFLQEYRALLLTWATQCNENAMSILQSRGFDSRQPRERSEWMLPGKHMSYDYYDPRFWEEQEKALTEESSSPADLMKQSLIPQSVLYFSMSPLVIRTIEDEARRLMMYRYRLYQCFPQYQDSMQSYEIFLQYSRGFIHIGTYIGYVRICLSQGDYTKAKSLLTVTWRKFYGKEIKAFWVKEAEEAKKKGITRKKRIIISDDYNLLEIPKASDLLPINRELSVLWKFTEIQLEALNKVNVFSKENDRLYRIREDGLIRKNTDYPAPEIVHGRDLLYRQRIEQLEKEKVIQEALKEKQRAQDELLDGIVSVKSRLMKLLKDDNVIHLAKSMNLNELLN